MAAARAVGNYRNAMEQRNRQSRQPLLWVDRQHQRLRARPQAVPLCPEIIFSVATNPRRADLLRGSAECAARRVGRFPPIGARQPLRSWSPFFVIFEALNSPVIDTVMGHVNVRIDYHLTSCCSSVYRASGETALVMRQKLWRRCSTP